MTKEQTETGLSKAAISLRIDLADSPHKLGWYLGYSRLKPIHGQWIKKVWGSTQPVTLQAHRQSYKTTSVMIVGAMWCLLFNPNWRILFGRKEVSGAISVLKAIRTHYRGEKMVALYDKLEITDNFHLVEDTDNRVTLCTKRVVTVEGSIEVTGIGCNVTGAHYDRIHTDDIITMKDRLSKAERERTKAFFRELHNIIEFGQPITNTGTPWHPEDAFSIMPEALKYPLGSIQIDEMTEAALEEIKRRTTHSEFCANYELRHIADIDRHFSEPAILKPEEVPSTYMPRGHIDPAYKGSNTTAMTLMQDIGGMIIACGFVWPDDIMKLFGKIGSIIQRFRVGTTHIEYNADKGFSAREIRGIDLGGGVAPIVADYDEKMNKHVKIISYLKRDWHRIVWHPETMPEYLNQIVDYQEGEEPDDAPDSAASLLRELTGPIVTEEEYGGDTTGGLYDNDERMR